MADLQHGELRDLVGGAPRLSPNHSAIARLRLALEGEAQRVVVIVAHPDDETIGAGVALGRMRDRYVIHLTDGAPADRRFVSPTFHGTTAEYAEVRHRESVAALALASVGESAIRSLGCTDQETIYHVRALTESVLVALEFFTPDLIVTSSYEGGHPDHDTCALVVHAAAEMLRKRRGLSIPVAELALYHAEGGAFVPSRFLASDGDLVLEPTAAETERKRAMFAAYDTQRDVLAQFTAGPERFRAAPEYDFTRAPHEGQLWYEVLGWPMTGAKWRRLAAVALGELGLTSPRWL